MRIPLSRRALIASAGATVVLLLAGVGAMVGLPAWSLIGLSSVPWVIAFAHRFGATLTTVGVGLTATLAFFLSLFGTAATGLPLLGTVVVCSTLAGIGGVAMCLRERQSIRPPSRLALAVWVPSTLGGLVWIATMIASRFVASANELSWVMLGDSANNLLFGRELVQRNGIGIDITQNPVPLPASFIGIALDSGRAGVAADALSRHDIVAFATVWSALIVLTCVMCGVVASTIARSAGGRSLLVAVVAAGTSLVPLSWFISGYALEYGFFNTHVSLPILFAAFLAYLAHREHPALSLSVLLVAATLVLAVWSPLVVIVAGLGIVVVVSQFRRLLATRGLPLVGLAIAMGQLLVYGLLLVLPSLLKISSAFAAAGAVYNFHKTMFAVVALALIGAAAVAYRRQLRDHVLVGALVVVAASALGLGALLFAVRDTPNPWSYYPMKFAWLVTVYAIVLIIGYASGAVARITRPVWIRGVGLAVVAALILGFLAFAPGNRSTDGVNDAVSSVLEGRFIRPGDVVAEQIFEKATPEQATVLWQSDNPDEGTINFWVWSLWADSVTGNTPLRVAAYGLYDHDDPAELCSIMGYMDGDVIVETTDDTVEPYVDANCPELNATVIEPR